MSEWIKVSDRLPERIKRKSYTRDVILYSPSGGYRLAYYDYDDECWVEAENEYIIHKVKLWADIPKLPKEG